MARKHGGLAEIIASRRAPGARVPRGGIPTQRIQEMRVPGVPRPPGGFRSAAEVDAASKAAGVPAAPETGFCKRVNESLREGDVSADTRTDR